LRRNRCIETRNIEYRERFKRKVASVTAEFVILFISDSDVPHKTVEARSSF